MYYVNISHLSLSLPLYIYIYNPMSWFIKYKIRKIFRGRCDPPLHAMNTTAVAVATAVGLWQQINEISDS